MVLECLSRVVWTLRFAILALRERLQGRHLQAEFLGLAWEAARLRDGGKFRRAMRRVPDVADLDAPSAAATALDAFHVGCEALAAQLFEAALARQPCDPNVLRLYGCYLAEGGREDEAVPYLERSLAQDARCSQAWCWLGNACYKTGMLAQARECYERSVETGENAPGEALMGLAFVAGEEGHWAQAVRLWRQAITHLAGNATAWYNLGNALAGLREWREARRAFRKCLRLGWEEPHRALYGIALANAELGRLRAAKKYCRKALAIAPDYDLALELASDLND